jgi:microcompartment protein CcmL/EutN
MPDHLVVEPALALLELDSIAAGIEAGDAMAKRAPIEVIRAGTVHPGKYLVLVGGAVADVEEALAAGREVGAASVLDVVLLPNVHPGVVAAMRGERRQAAGEALGVIETATVAAVI